MGEDIEEYVSLLQREISYVRNGLNSDMERQGYPPLDQDETQGLLYTNVLKLWQA